ncbi:MAG: hypothetical protein KKF68_01020 [Nanoarchaeota archaeon]|nr:hypothetical protein [Nanoarchaeota archaeon]
MIDTLNLPVGAIIILIIILLWELVWKLIGMWKAAKKGSVAWFIVLAVLNTVGILSILYVYVFSEMKRSPKRKSQKVRTKSRASKKRKKKRR